MQYQFTAEAKKFGKYKDITGVWTDGLAVSVDDGRLERGVVYRVTLTIERMDVDSVCSVPPTSED